MADLLDFAGVRAFTTDADAGAGYVARFYQSGTTTPVTVYTSGDLGTAHGTSVTADASGVFPAVWVSTGTVKCTIETPAGAIVQTIDPVFSHSTATGASGVGFEPTVDLPFTNVQDAIEGAAASAASGFTPYGLGITGSATLLADIDATGIGAGAYRFDNTTTGTYPTGVAAADTGLVEHWRQAAGTAMQVLYHATSDRVFHRRMASAAWGTWREVITAPQGAAEGDLLYRAASAWARLAKGAAGQLLRMNSGASAPEWASGTGWEHVSQFYTGTSVANVDTPAFEAGYDYAIRTSWVRGATNPSTFLFQAFKAVATAYTPTIQLKGSDSNYSTIWLEILAPMQTADQHRYRADLAAFTDNNTVAYAGVTADETNYITVYGGVNDRISGLRFTRGSGNVSGGLMSLFRRPTRMT